MPSKQRSRTGERGGRLEVRAESGRLTSGIVEILKQVPHIKNSVSYKSAISAEASALQRQVEDCQGRYDSAQGALNELSAVVKTQSGDTKKKTDDAMVAARSRMNTVRMACDRANDEFLGKGTVLNIKSGLERQFPSLGDLKSRMLTVDAIKNAVSSSSSSSH